MLDWETGYITHYRGAVQSLRAGSSKLGDAQKKKLVDEMKTSYPAAGLDFMIGLGADAVAGELAHKQLNIGGVT